MPKMAVTAVFGSDNTPIKAQHILKNSQVIENKQVFPPIKWHAS
jgi:hypothetical protein